MARKHFRVWAWPTNSDDDGRATTFAVEGPRINEYAIMREIAVKMERALNAPPPRFTPAELHAIGTALGFALAGETDGWSPATIAAMRRAHSKLED